MDSKKIKNIFALCIRKGIMLDDLTMIMMLVVVDYLVNYGTFPIGLIAFILVIALAYVYSRIWHGYRR